VMGKMGQATPKDPDGESKTDGNLGEWQEQEEWGCLLHLQRA